MKIIAPPVCTPDSIFAQPPDGGLSPASDSNRPSFKDLLADEPDRWTDEKDKREPKRSAGDSELPDATDSALQAALLLLQPPVQQTLPPPVPVSENGGEPLESNKGSAATPAQFEPGEGTAQAESSVASATNSETPGLAGQNASAKFAVVTADVAPEARADKTQTGQSSGETSSDGADGTAAAMQRRAMPENLREHHFKPTASAESSQREALALARVSQPREESDVPRTEPAPGAAIPSAEIAPSNSTAGEFPVRTGEAKPAELQTAARFVDQMMDIAERINAKDSHHVEVQMRLLDGQEVSVSLHLENGAWKPVFRTGTDALCKALEHGWQQAAAQPADRLVRFGTPVFESLQTQTGLGGGTQQQPDAREQFFARRDQESFTAPPPRRSRGASAPIVPEYFAASSGVRLYA
jgi:hypothetical protein